MTINKVITKPQRFDAPKKNVGRKERRIKIAQAIKMLNDVVKIKIGPSAIHGVGVIAMRDIRKGEKLYADALPQILDTPYKDFDKLRPEIREHLLGRFPLIVTGSHFLYPDSLMSASLNHSDTPNYDAKLDKAIKNIKEGEEVTEDYRKIDDSDKIFPWLKQSVV